MNHTIFVHGLSGSADKTWADFKAVLESDHSLPPMRVNFFEYESKFLRMPFTKRIGSISELAQALGTFVRRHVPPGQNLLLVGHSLGALIIRKYLLTELIENGRVSASKALLFAPPNDGASLARIPLAFPWQSIANAQVRDLCRNSDALHELNDRWANSQIDQHLDVCVVWSKNDRIVSQDSAKSILRAQRVETLLDHTHRTIVKPKSTSDGAYEVFRSFLDSSRSITKSPIAGAMEFDAWAAYIRKDETDFTPDEPRKTALANLDEELNRRHGSARIIGLSGLGKTRLALEAFNQPKLSTRRAEALYIDAPNDTDKLSEKVQQWVSTGHSGIMVVDNCVAELHDKLDRLIRTPNSKLSLLTLDFNLERSESQSNVIHLKPMSDSAIKAMIEPSYGVATGDLERIVGFAQGFPQMAVLLIRARRNGDPEMGKLNDDTLATRLLWGDRESRNEDKEMKLRACSVFDRFGVEGAASVDIQFIAKEMLGLDSSDSLYSCISDFWDRGIVDRRGDYARLVPKPLAVRLASQWWRTTSPERQTQLIESEIPEGLLEAFCTQISMLDFLPEVKELTSTICGSHGPFGQAEMILSERGSLIVRAFSEISPSVIADRLRIVLEEASNEQLYDLDAAVRRNLVWALEKLAFRKTAFSSAAHALFRLARNESESWSNNATGILQQMFRVFLSGTEADLDQRWSALCSLLETNDDGNLAVVVSALDAALTTGGASRTVGAEHQGMGPPLVEWRPKLWGEAFQYWDAALTKLADLAVQGSQPISDRAMAAIATNIRSLTLQGRVEALDFALKAVVEARGKDWPAALQAISDLYSYDYEQLPAAGQQAVDRWSTLLRPESIADQLAIVVGSAPYRHSRGSDGEYVDIARNEAAELGRRLASDDAWRPHASILVSGEQRQAVAFGEAVALNTEELEDTVDIALEALSGTDDPNPAFLYGLLLGARTRDPIAWAALLDRVYGDSTAKEWYPSAVTTGPFESVHLDRILDLLDERRIQPRNLGVLGTGRSLDHLDSQSVAGFCRSLAARGADHVWIALDLISMYCHANEERFSECSETFLALIQDVEFKEGDGSPASMDAHHWMTACKQLIKNGGENAAAVIARKAVNSWEAEYSVIHHSIRPVLAQLLESAPDESWPVIRDALEASRGLERFKIHSMLEKDGVLKRGSSLVMKLHIEHLMSWCEQSPEVAPQLLASIIDVYEEEEDGGYRLSEIASWLLREFGELDVVLSSMESNVGSFGWTGSLVPYLERELRALELMDGSSNPGLRRWADRRRGYLEARRAAEQKSDEESEWGIY